MDKLILTVTRACNLRCSYCPTAKDGWPSLRPEQARRALELFAARGGGEVKLFGGEPLLAPEAVRAVFDALPSMPAIQRVQLSTNGLGLDEAWLERIRSEPRSILVISLDGAPEDHRRLRRALPGVPDAWDRVMELRPALIRMPRVVITQTIAPSTAARARENFRFLVGLGFTRFNLLPGYYLPWRPHQLAALEEGLAGIADDFRAAWAADQALSLRNLFTWAPTPFFNSGMVVDSDGSIHPSNLGLSGKLDHLREQTRAGTLEHPPSPEALAAKAAEVNRLLQEHLEPGVWESTLAVDAALTRMVGSLYAPWQASRARRRKAS